MTNANTTLTLRSLNIPGIQKFGIGFDSMLDELLRSTSSQQSLNYPPYNLLQLDENVFCIEVAVAGFKEGEIEVTIEKNLLTIKGAKLTGDLANVEYLHRGISTRNFERTFPLGPHIEVTGAIVRDGMLTIDLVREIPETEKPKSIAISYIK